MNKFKVKCMNCGSEEDVRFAYDDETGEIKMVVYCENCDEEELIRDSYVEPLGIEDYFESTVAHSTDKVYSLSD